MVGISPSFLIPSFDESRVVDESALTEDVWTLLAISGQVEPFIFKVLSEI